MLWSQEPPSPVKTGLVSCGLHVRPSSEVSTPMLARALF